MNIVDLHVHSNRSDGSMTPSELVDLAVEKGLSAFALTDHDCVAGIPEALSRARYWAEQGIQIEVIPGIEFSTEYMGKDIHIVGIDIDDGFDKNGGVSNLAYDILTKCESYTEKSSALGNFLYVIVEKYTYQCSRYCCNNQKTCKFLYRLFKKCNDIRPKNNKYGNKRCKVQRYIICQTKLFLVDTKKFFYEN